jgi:hypothetical protein
LTYTYSEDALEYVTLHVGDLTNIITITTTLETRRLQEADIREKEYKHIHIECYDPKFPKDKFTEDHWLDSYDFPKLSQRTGLVVRRLFNAKLNTSRVSVQHGWGSNAKIRTSNIPGRELEDIMGASWILTYLKYE